MNYDCLDKLKLSMCKATCSYVSMFTYMYMNVHACVFVMFVGAVSESVYKHSEPKSIKKE